MFSFQRITVLSNVINVLRYAVTVLTVSLKFIGWTQNTMFR